MRKVHLEGLDENGMETHEEVTLDGTTPVTTTGKFYRMYRFFGTEGGSGQTNAGTITVRHSFTTANVFGVMPVGYGQGQLAFYTVPASHRGLILRVKVGVSNAQQAAHEATVTIATRRYNTNIWRYREPVVVSTSTAAEERPLGGWVVDPLTDVKMRVIGATSDSLFVAGRFDILYQRI